MKKFKFLMPILLLIFLITPTLVLAAEGGTGDVGGTGGTGGKVSFDVNIKSPFECGDDCTIQWLIETIINDIILPIGGVIAVIMVIYAGFLFVTAQGSPEKISKAKQALLYAVIGAAILLGAWVIAKAIGATIDELRGISS